MTQALYLKWRPQVWDDVVGQEHVTRTLRNAIASDRVHHAYLFAGPRGCGKTSMARLVAKAVNCLDPDRSHRPCNTCAHCLAVNQGRFLDLIEIDGASNNSVDDIRDLRDKINFSPNEGRYKVYVIDEVHMLSTGAFNALLKTLEEPPPHAIFVLATTEVHKIPATVLSRCQRHEFRLIPQAETVARLKVMAAEEGMPVEEAALEVVARHATGSLRDAISLLDQLGSGGEAVTLARAQDLLGAAASQAVQDLVEALAGHDTARGLTLVNQTIDAGSDPRQLARQIVDYLRGLLMARMDNPDLIDATAEVRAAMGRQAALFEVGELLRAVRAFNAAIGDLKTGWQPQLPLELAFVEVALPAAEATAPALASQARPAAPAGRTLRRAGRVSETAPGLGGSSPSVQPASAPVRDPAARVEVRATPARTPEPASPPGGEAPVNEVARSWKKVTAAVRKYDPLTQGLLNSCTPVGVEGSALILAFTSDVLKAKMEKGNHVTNVGRALADVMGQELQVKCVLASRDRKSQAATDELPDDGMAATALRELGAQVVDIQ